MEWIPLILLVWFVATAMVVNYAVKKAKPAKKPRAKAPDKRGPGFVYVMSNPAYRDGIFKIGLTSKEPEVRAKQLYTTGVPDPFNVCIVYSVENMWKLEQELHEKFSSKRRNPRREFFDLGVYDLKWLARQGSVIARNDHYIREALGHDPAAFPDADE